MDLVNVKYVTIMDLAGSVYRIPSDLVQEFNELDEKLFEATNEAILSQSESMLKYSDLLNEWCEKFEKYRIED